MCLLYEGHSIGSLIALAVLAFFILLYVFLPHLQVNRIIQECRIFFGSEMVIQSAFFDSKLVISSVQMKKEMVIEYEQIVRILKTKHLFLLEMRDSFILFVDQSGFSKGNQKDFETFIQLCAKNAKIQF